MSPFSSNMSTNTTNSNSSSTGHFDYFCRELYVGPLLWGIFGTLSSLVGLPANVRLLWAQFAKGCGALLSSDIYLLNRTMMDLLLNSITIPGTLNYFVWRADVPSVLVDIFSSLSLIGRPLLTVCICVDCYLAVLHPIPYMRLRHGRYRLVACASVWALSVTYALSLLGEENVDMRSFFAVPYVLSLPVIAFCDVTVLLALRKPDPSGRTDIHPQKQRALQTITNSFIMSTVAYLPPMVIFGFSSLMPLPRQSLWCSVFFPTFIFPLLGNTIMPLLYLQNLGYFKGCGSHGRA